MQSKINGTRQLKDVIFDTYPRPIESAMESNRLPPSAETCEQCHDREKFIGSRLRILTGYNSDEPNTRTDTVLTMAVGGGNLGGIHGAHMGPGVHIRYAASDRKRQTIPRVEYGNTVTGVTRTYIASGMKADSVRSLPTFEMQCVDCHNRAAHTFELPDHAVDRALAQGQIPLGLPFIKKTAVKLLKATYVSQQNAEQNIPAGLNGFYQRKYGDIWARRSNDIQLAGRALVEIHSSNVLPDLKVTWGTYPNNLGHMDDPGCFRCHDDSHVTADKQTITQDCNTCHQMLTTGEADSTILKALSLGQNDNPEVAKHCFPRGSRMRAPAAQAERAPPKVTPRSSNTSQSVKRLPIPLWRYGAGAGEDAALTVPVTTAVPVAATLANAPDAPSPRPTRA